MPTNGKRVAYGRNQVRVAIATYPDDTSVPVRTSHWNQDPHDQAILGFTKVTATLDASGVIYTKDDSSTYLEDNGSTYSRQSTLIEVECEGVTTTDVIAKIDVTDTNENDVLYLFKGTDGDTITIASATPSVAGHIKTQLSGGATLVHDGVPIMLIRRGDYWYEFGADGAAVAATFTATSTDTISSKSISLTTNTLTGTSAELATAINDETGSGLLVFGTSPTLITPALGIPASGVATNITGLPQSGVTSLTSDLALKAPLASPVLTSPSISYAINAQTGTTYTTVLADAGKIITSSNAGTVVITLPPNSSVAYPIGSSINVISIGAGLTNFAIGAGVTINSTGAVPAAPVLRIAHSSATAIKTATDTWQVVGDIS